MVFLKLFNKGIGPTTGVTTVYTVPANKAAILKEMRFVNAGVQATLTAYFKRGSTAVRILDKDKVIATTEPNNLVAIEDELCLEAGDLIQLYVTPTNSAVHYMLSGIERDQ